MAFNPHPGMPPPGMGPGMGPMPGGPPMGQPPGQAMPVGMHPGMPGPGGPHVTQAGQMMGGMPPGMTPNVAHAMQHLQPQQMFANQGMAGAFPQNAQAQAAAQQAQQNMIIERQRMAMQQGVRPGNMPPNMAMMGAGPMGPQQFQNLQQQNLRHLNFPGNLQQQMRQQQQQQQQLLMHQQQMQNANGNPGNANAGPGGPGPGQVSGAPQINGPPGQPTPMRSQSSMQGMPPGQGPGQESAQQTPNAQNRPPPDHAQQPDQPPNQRQGPPNQPGSINRPPSSQPNQQPPHTLPQASPAASLQGGINGQAQQTAQNQQPGQPGQQPQPGQPGSNQQPGQGGQPGGPMAANADNSRQQHIEHLRRTAMAQNSISNIAPPQVQRPGMMQYPQVTPAGTIRLMQFADRLSGYQAGPNGALPSLDMWRALVSDFFSDEAIHRVHLSDSTRNGKDMYEIPQAALPRYYAVQFSSGVKSISIMTGGAKQREHPPSMQYVECSQAAFNYTFHNGLQVKCEGILKAWVGPQGKFDLLEFDIANHEELMPSARIRQLFSAADSPQNQTKSPKMMKQTAKQKNQQQRPPPTRSITLNENEVPNAQVRSDGVTVETKMFLENSETFARMGELMNFAHGQNHTSGNMALDHFINSPQGPPSMPPNAQQFSIPQGMNMGAMGPGAQFRNPFANGAGANMNAFNSPGHQGLGLPNAANSPHLRAGGSPGMMAAMPPAMAAQMMQQQSAQGTSSSTAPSSTASPNASSKKRRASAVKGEGGDDGGGPAGGQANGDGNKLKATPKMGKRQKGNNS